MINERMQQLAGLNINESLQDPELKSTPISWHIDMLELDEFDTFEPLAGILYITAYIELPEGYDPSQSNLLGRMEQEQYKAVKSLGLRPDRVELDDGLKYAKIKGKRYALYGFSNINVPMKNLKKRENIVTVAKKVARKLKGRVYNPSSSLNFIYKRSHHKI